VRQDRGTVDVKLVLDADVVTENGNVFHAPLHMLDEHLVLKLTQRPTVLFQPMIELAIHAWSRTSALERITQRWRRTPLPILAPGPMTTFGPMTAVGSISAV